MSLYSRTIAKPRVIRSEPTHRVASLIVPLPPAPGTPTGGTTFTDRLETVRRAGYDEGYAAALTEVNTAEAASRAAQLHRIADAATRAADALAQGRAGAVEVATSEAVELAVQLAEAVLQRELSDRTTVVDALRRAVKLAPDGEDLEVRIHPGDPLDPNELEALTPGVAVKIVADPAVERGACVLTAAACRIDMQVAPALERARRVLAELAPPAPERIEVTA